MSESLPQTWHYGLVARWWAEFNTADAEELAFYQEFIAGDGQPALDLACGAGRLLLPMLRAGLDVDGCDISPDMLARCRELAAAEGLRPRLYQQAMHELDLPRAYRTMYICDSFGIGAGREEDMETLRRCHALLAPGGTLLFNLYLPYGELERWNTWLPERLSDLPEPWPDEETRKRAADGDEIGFSSRLFAFDPLWLQQALQIRSRLWRDDVLVQEEERILLMNLYFHPEMMLMLATAGFAAVDVRSGYSAAPPALTDPMLVYVARKAG